VRESRLRAAARAEAHQEAVRRDRQGLRVHRDHLGRQARRDLRVRPDLEVQRDPPVRRVRRRDHLVRRACPAGVVARAACRAEAESPVAAHSGVEEL
jgi:hypothetical protein